MDLTGATSPPPIRVHDYNGNGGLSRSTRRPMSNFASGAQGPMMIPNARQEAVPPPLPPPRYMDDLAAGSEPEHRWGTMSSDGSFGRSDSSFSSSSGFHRHWERRRMEGGDSASRRDSARQGRSSMTARSPTELHMKADPFRHIDEGYHSMSGSSVANNQSVLAFLSRSCPVCKHRFGRASCPPS